MDIRAAGPGGIFRRQALQSINPKSVNCRGCVTDNETSEDGSIKGKFHFEAPPRAKRSVGEVPYSKIIWPVVMPWLRVNGKEHYQMAKDKQQKHDVAKTNAVSSKMKRKEFEKELTKLQIELTRLQTWVQAKGVRVIVVFEGRDTAGKAGVISRTSPRVYRHVALPAPSDREKTQVYVQR